MQNGSKISMGLTAQDNAYVERFHRTIKEEYLKYWKPNSLTQLRKCIDKAVNNYNGKRTHKNLKKMSPEQFEKQWIKLDNKERPILTIFDNEIFN